MTDAEALVGITMSVGGCYRNISAYWPRAHSGKIKSQYEIHSVKWKMKHAIVQSLPVEHTKHGLKFVLSIYVICEALV